MKLKAIITCMVFIMSLGVFGQKALELKIEQKNYMCCTHQIKIDDNRLTIMLLWPKKKKIYNRKIKDIECYNNIIKLIDSEDFKKLKSSYKKEILDGYKWEYEIKYGEKEFRIVNGKDSIELLLKLNRLINELIANKKKRILEM